MHQHLLLATAGETITVDWPDQATAVAARRQRLTDDGYCLESILR
jgi:hypothetical protein